MTCIFIKFMDTHISKCGVIISQQRNVGSHDVDADVVDDDDRDVFHVVDELSQRSSFFHFKKTLKLFFYFWLVSLQKSRRILEGGGLKQNWNIKLQVLTHSKSVIMGVGCGSIGRAVASDTRGPRLESSHWQTLR